MSHVADVGVSSPKAAPEDRRLKAAGLLFLSAGLGLFAWLSGRGGEGVSDPVRLTQLAAVAFLGVNLFLAGLWLVVAGCGGQSSWRTPKRRRALLLQIVLTNLLAPPLLFGLLASDDSLAARLEQSGIDIPLTIAVYVLSLSAWRMWRRSQRYEAIDADEAMARDPRPPVLYLRSFKDDGSSLLDVSQQGMAIRAITLIQPPTPEQELADILGQLGPVIAIGKPGESLPELGAARLYVEHHRWQAKVEELMRKAGLVVIRLGDSPGILWEVQQALAMVPRERLVFAFLNGTTMAPAVASLLRPIIGAEWNAALPDSTPSGWKAWLWTDPRRRIGSFVHFGPDGRAHAIAVRSWPPWGRDAWLTLMLRPSALPLRRTWRELFSRLGVAAGTMDKKPSRAIAVVLALVAGYAGAHWFYLGKTRRGWTYVALIAALLASVFMGFYDALRFIWVDRATFDKQFVA